MKALYFDCFSGISGDMILGALIDLGIDVEKWKTELNKIPVKGYKIEISKKQKNSIWGTDVNIIIDDHHSHRHLEDLLKNRR